MSQTAPLIELSGVVCGYGHKAVLSDVNFSMGKGELLCLLGPNGIGKTTLFKTLLRLLPPLAGTIRIRGQNVADWPVRRFARCVGYVPQVHMPPFPFSVIDVAVMGRVAHLGAFSGPSTADRQYAEAALESLSIGHLRDRVYTELSGGERQLVLVARALTQEPELLVLDEPTSNLDYGHQIDVLEHVRRLTTKLGLGVVMTTHDPNQALGYATKVAAIGRTGTLQIGPPEDLVTESYIFDTYRVRTQIVSLSANACTRRFCLPVSSPKPGEG